MVKRIKRTETFWNQLMAEFEARPEGMSQMAFCKLHGVPCTTFCTRRKKFLAKAMMTRSTQTSPFIELEFSPRPATSQVGALPMVLEYGPFRLRTEGLPDPGWLAELLVRTQEVF